MPIYKNSYFQILNNDKKFSNVGGAKKRLRKQHAARGLDHSDIEYVII